MRNILGLRRGQHDCNATAEFDLNVDLDRQIMSAFYTRAIEHTFTVVFPTFTD